METKKRSHAEIGKASRNKGKRGELILSKIFQAAGWKDAHRTQQYCGRASKGQAPDVSGVPGVSIECKWVERLDFRKAYKQSADTAKWTDDIPIVCTKRDHEDWLVVLSLNDFIKIFKSYIPPEGDAD